ncbi:MAG: helix-turn-helix domain-containing protein, partial [Actinomycetales bacterium]
MSDFPPPGGVPGPPSARTVVLDALRSAPAPATAADLAAECSVPLSSVRFHLNALLLTGTVRRTTDPANGRGRPRVRYSAVRSAPLPAIASGYRLLAEILAESLAGGADDRPASGPGAGQAGGPGAAAQA